MVEILLIIGVIPNKSRPYPNSNPIAPEIRNILIFLKAVLSDINIFPQIDPQMVCAAVGMQFMATHPPPLIFPIRIKSIQEPKFSPFTKGFWGSYARYKISVNPNKPREINN